MSGAGQEMTLAQWVNELPASHLVHKQLAALTSRAEAAECQLAAVQKLYGDKSEQYLAERRRTDAAEVQVAACRGYVQDWDDSKKAAVDVIAKIRAVTASSLPASPATEKLQDAAGKIEALEDHASNVETENAELQARVKELEGALRPFAEYVDGSHKAFTDDSAITVGSPMARRQLTIGDCRRAASALKGEG